MVPERWHLTGAGRAALRSSGRFGIAMAILGKTSPRPAQMTAMTAPHARNTGRVCAGEAECAARMVASNAARN
jgi:hypothetical protein